MDAYQQFIFYRTYSRWLPEHRRRETWGESVSRLVNFYQEVVPQISDKDYSQIFDAIFMLECLPSMRLLAMAGPAVRENNACAYNCSYLPIDSIESFSECLLLLMSGTGIGFSVETKYVDQLPRIRRQGGHPLDRHIIEDTTDGWVNALRVGLVTWFSGASVNFDYSQIRPSGAYLKTKGGYASGPEPLRALLDFARDLVVSRQGSRLDPIHCHDLVCKIGEVVVFGGVRRAAELSLSDPDDIEMRMAKAGQFWHNHPQRAVSNNSVAYDEKPSATAFMEEWLELAKSGSGERGIFNRAGVIKTRPVRREPAEFGTNPCGEIILRPYQFCNLTEVVARANDTHETLRRKMRLATIMGTIQSTLTKFPGLRHQWHNNCNEERLLGVSITGMRDCPLLNTSGEYASALLTELLELAQGINRVFAEQLGIPPSKAITCVKPSGTVSQLVNSSSGLHTRWSKHYVRRVRIFVNDPLFELMRTSGVPCYPEVGQTEKTATTWVLEFPIKSPGKSMVRHQTDAIEQLEYWKMVRLNYTEHNPSATIYVGPDEWLKVGAWVYENWDLVGGLSFLPRSEHVYLLAPYEEITEERYEELAAAFPKVDYARLPEFEQFDQTTSETELACGPGGCELV